MKNRLNDKEVRRIIGNETGSSNLDLADKAYVDSKAGGGVAFVIDVGTITSPSGKMNMGTITTPMGIIDMGGI